MHSSHVSGVTLVTPVVAPPVVTIFKVWSAGGAWCLQGAAFESLMFLSEADAEREGRRLARCLAGLGQDAQVQVYDARDLLSGTARYFAEDEPSATRSASDHVPVVRREPPSADGALRR